MQSGNTDQLTNYYHIVVMLFVGIVDFNSSYALDDQFNTIHCVI